MTMRLFMKQLLGDDLHINWLKNFNKTPEKYFVKNTRDYFVLNIYKLRVTLFK